MNEVYKLFRQVPHPKDVNDYYHCLNVGNILNSLYWWNFFEMISDVDGDIVECGVGRGRSLITIMSINNYLKELDDGFSKKVYALDSFQGFPKPTEFDSSPRNPQEGEWSVSPNKQFKYSVDSLKKVLNSADLNDLSEDRFEIVKGFFEKTTLSVSVDKISILHLDGDLYNSVSAPLKNLWDKISVGGVVVVDDYIADKKHEKNEPFPGARKAVEDFLESNDCFEFNVSMRGTPYLVRIK